MKRYRINDLVRIGKGKRVYRIRHVFPDGRAKIEADAKHPQAAKRVPDEFRTYSPGELIRVEEVPA